MPIDTARVSEQPADRGRPTMVEMIERLSRFDGPPEQFLVNLLAVQCHLAAADGGAILRVNPDQRVEILAVYPQPAPGSTAPVWLAQSAESAPQVVRSGRAAVRPLHGPDDLYGQPASKHLVLLPLRGGSGVLGLAAFMVASSDTNVLAAAQQRLELTVSLLSLYEMRLTLQQRQGDLMRLRMAMETTAAVNEHDRFAGSAMAFCNEVASRWDCDRAALGFLKGRYVHLKAMSHTEKFSRKMKLVQDIEAAMEETLDQDVEVLYPAPQEATFANRAAGELSKRQGPSAVLSLPLRRADEVAAVLTLERPQEDPFAFDEIEALRLVCDLCTARLVSLHQQDRWFGARAAAAARRGLGVLLGPKHTWIKLAAIGVCAAIVFLVFFKGQFRAEGPFVLEAVTQRVVPAPFEGYLKQVYVRPGDEAVGAYAEDPSWSLKDKSVVDWAVFLAELRAQGEADEPSVGKRIWGMLSPETRGLVKSATARDANAAAAAGLTDATGGGGPAAEPNAPAGPKGPDTEPTTPSAPGRPDSKTRDAVLRELNEILALRKFYEEDAWPKLQKSDRQKDLLEMLAEGRLRGERLVELNRSLLAAAYPGRIAPGPTVLGTLETAELRLELTAAEAERHGYLKQVIAAMREGKQAEAQIAQAQADQVQAKARLLERRIAQAALVAPISGYVVSGDLRRQLGAPVKTGDGLFEIADLADLRAELSVPEDLIADAQTAYALALRQKRPLTGELATTARPDERIPFEVERINPVAEVVEQNNVFKVRVRLMQTPSVFRPGMEGVGKIDIDRRSYAYLWTRRLINWIRMKLWV